MQGHREPLGYDRVLTDVEFDTITIARTHYGNGVPNRSEKSHTLKYL